MTTKQFLEKNGYSSTNYRFFFQSLIDCIGSQNITPFLPATQEILMKSYKEDRYLNNIQLSLWMEHSDEIREMLKKYGINTISNTEIVCILKQAAKYEIGVSKSTAVSRSKIA